MSGEEQLEWRGVQVVVDPGEFLGYYTFLFGDFSRLENDVLLDSCEDAEVFFDVGANMGLVSLAVANRWPGLTVLAFEPDPNIAAKCQANLTRNPGLKDRIRLRNEALGAADGRMAFQRADAHNLGTGHLVQQGSSAPSIEVPIRTVDSVCREVGLTPQVVKIDVEGAELDVLRGMSKLFASTPPHTMLIELHGFYRPGDRTFYRDIHSILFTAGYELHQVLSDRFIPAAHYDTWASRIHLLARHSSPRRRELPRH